MKIELLELAWDAAFADESEELRNDAERAWHSLIGALNFDESTRVHPNQWFAKDFKEVALDRMKLCVDRLTGPLSELIRRALDDYST